MLMLFFWGVNSIFVLGTAYFWQKEKIVPDDEFTFGDEIALIFSKRYSIMFGTMALTTTVLNYAI